MTQTERILARIQRLKKELKYFSATEALDYIESYVNLVARESEEECLKIKGWVTRDVNHEGGELNFFTKMPESEGCPFWGGGGQHFTLEKRHYGKHSVMPEVLFKNSPVEVELIIREVK